MLEMAKEKDWKLVASREKYLNKEYVPSKILQYLDGFLTEQDKEIIVADEQNHGAIHASSTLVCRLKRRGEMAFSSFVTALRSAGYFHAAQLLDPHYDVHKLGIEAIEDEGVAVAGVVADIRIEVSLTSSNGERFLDKEKFICNIYSKSKTDETIKLRVHFMKSLYQDPAKSPIPCVYDQYCPPGSTQPRDPCQTLYMKDGEENVPKSWIPVFVKTTTSKTNPPALVLIFRLSDVKAAEKLWDAFKSEKLKSMIEKGLKHFEQIKDEEVEVTIQRKCYDKVLKTLHGSEHSVLIDGEEKKDLVLRKSQHEPALPAFESKNTILCAPTGFGKTFVAMAIIKEHLPSPRRKKVVFIVNTVSLVHQQQQRLEIYLPEGVRVASLCGNNSDVPLYDVLESNDVVVLTAQILVDALKKGDNITISYFSLLVFDECHHTKGNHAYNNIMRFYTKDKRERKSPNLPQILGLSASLGIGTKNPGNENIARNHVLEICANLDAEILQVAESDQQTTVTKLIPISRKEISDFKKDIIEVMEEIESKLDGSHGSASCERGTQPYETWVVALFKEDLGRDFMTCAEHLREYNNALMISEDLRTRDALKYLHDNIRSKGETAVERRLQRLYESTREKILSRQSDAESHETNAWLRKLEELLLEKFTDNKNGKSRVIVFVRTRFAAVALEDWMKNSTTLKTVVKPTHVIGCGQRNGSEGMTKVLQDVRIKRFRDGHDCNVIVGTSMLLEGIDIPDCDFVINYGMPGNEITNVQARGRVRTKGTFVIIMDHDKCMLKERDLEKEKLMKVVTMKIASMTTEEFKKQVHRLQKDAYEEEEELRRVGEESKQEQKPLVDGINFHCMKCGEFACEVKHVKVCHKVHHLVPNHVKTLKSLKFKETERKINFHNGLIKIGEIFCGKCDHRWGIMTNNQHGQFPCVKIKNFRVKGNRDTEDQVFKQWKDFPYEIQQFDPSELENTEESDSV